MFDDFRKRVFVERASEIYKKQEIYTNNHQTMRQIYVKNALKTLSEPRSKTSAKTGGKKTGFGAKMVPKVNLKSIKKRCKKRGGKKGWHLL